ncbi:hypothetical protein FQN60_014658 [Etheostoma spectabile]|uniref:Uncharacterized protein n=1 Tax=Etheostoma spectabile TaxID=54343 RepID=A0A5J5DB06_9PERO|nr:hypothetical protein FQN60_014658 [Etheostoma spectabile]
MYFPLFSLPLKDLIGITAMLPKVISDIVTKTNLLSSLCFASILLHMFGFGLLFMSFARYAAICMPCIISFYSIQFNFIYSVNS